MSRIPLDARKPDLVVDVPGVPLRVAVAYGAAWVTSFHGEELVRIDERTGKVTDRIPTGAGPEGVTDGFGSIWLVAQDAGELLRIDPASRRVVDRIDIGVGARLVTTGGGAVWVSHFADNTVLRIDPESGEVTASAELCDGPQGLAVVAGQVWTACTFSDQVLGLDPQTLEVTTDVAVAGFPDPLTVTPEGTLLAVPEQGPAVVAIDPASGEVLEERVLAELAPLNDSANLDADVVAGEVWVTSHSTDRVYHLPAH